jgi:Uma2 family endonuclease
MAVQEKLYTAEELAKMPENDKFTELVNGVIIRLQPEGFAHGVLSSGISYEISAFVHEQNVSGYALGFGAGYILSRNPDTVRTTDVAFISKSKLPDGLTGFFFPTAPDLAIEIVSPDDKASVLQEKLGQFLRAGTQLVWVFYPKTRTVEVHTPKGSHTVGVDAILDGDPVLPGFKLAVRDVFAVLGEQS